MSNGSARHFVYSRHIKMLMSLNYFELEHVKKMQLPLNFLQKGITKNCALFLTKIEGTSNYCYAGVRND